MGPGKASGSSRADAEYLKREQIRDRLRARGHDAYFSEELVSKGPSVASLEAQELAQLSNSDLVVCIGSSPGSASEAAAFKHLLGRGVLFWLPEKGKGTFSDLATAETVRHAGGKAPVFKMDDLDSCVLSAASCEWVEQKSLLAWQIDEQRKLLADQDFRKSR